MQIALAVKGQSKRTERAFRSQGPKLVARTCSKNQPVTNKCVNTQVPCIKTQAVAGWHAEESATQITANLRTGRWSKSQMKVQGAFNKCHATFINKIFFCSMQVTTAMTQVSCTCKEPPLSIFLCRESISLWDEKVCDGVTKHYVKRFSPSSSLIKDYNNFLLVTKKCDDLFVQSLQRKNHIFLITACSAKMVR